MTEIISLETLAARLDELEKEVQVYHKTARRLEHETEIFKQSNSSRMGLPGGRGETGSPGQAGRDAHIEIKTADGRVKVINLDTGKVEAEIVAVPGPEGKPGASIKGDTGASGRDGRSAPSLQEIVDAVVRVIEKRIAGN
jgi:hypothetical protein